MRRKAGLDELIRESKQGNRSSLARLLSILEGQGPGVLARHPDLLNPSHAAFRVGVTGPPGAGKSTLISRLIHFWRTKMDLQVGVLAIDPTSPFTEGAILGDRIRYQEHALDPGVFVRSLGSRGSMGGLSAPSWLMVRAFDVARFDVLVVETVGVGQTELDVMNVADHVVVVLTPESGDGIQGMKAGLTEIADLFAVNKSDRPGADLFTNELKAALELGAHSEVAQKRAVVQVSAATGSGVDEFCSTLEEVRTESSRWRLRRTEPARLQAEAFALLLVEAEKKLRQTVSQILTPQDLGRVLGGISH